jgi:hypothetical protein
MLGRNSEYEAMIADVDQKIEERERALLSGHLVAGTAATLSDLRETRQTIRMLLLNRRIEAAKRVVDLARWKDGNGALYRRPKGLSGRAAPTQALPSAG